MSGTVPPRQPPAIGPLGSEQVSRVLGLVDAATEADGVGPLSEATMLHIRHGAGSAGHTDVAVGNVWGYAHLEDPGPGDDFSGELVVDPAARRRGYGRELLAELTRLAAGRGPRIWAHGDLPAAAALARSAGFTRVRALWQMRRPLHASFGRVTLPSGVTLRPFAPGEDEEAWLEVNGRAFAKHPEQGSWTLEDLRLREAEPWFDPDGFILAERAGHLAGFHWTKIHPGSVGEVYVVGVDPAEQGSGLGRALTLAGLEYLESRNLDQVMLYVDEDNRPAVRMYESLGFSRWSTDVMYAPARGDRPASLTRVGAHGRLDAEHLVQLAAAQRPLARRHGTQHIGDKLDLIQGLAVVNPQVNLSWNRAHLRSHPRLPLLTFRLRRATAPPHDPMGPFANHPYVRFCPRLP